MAGKGSKRRGEKIQKFIDNYDNIDWRDDKECPKLSEAQMAVLLKEVKKLKDKKNDC